MVTRGAGSLQMFEQARRALLSSGASKRRSQPRPRLSPREHEEQARPREASGLMNEFGCGSASNWSADSSITGNGRRLRT